MNLHEFLSDPTVQLPLSWQSSQDFHAFVDARLRTYLGLIDHLDSSAVADKVKARKDQIRNCCEGILASLRLSLAGNPHEAFSRFDSAIAEVQPEIEQMATILDSDDLRLLYRVRPEPTPTLNREDIFHVPFEDRHKVSTQRYSIPGLPCLYLAGSLYACWEEMGRPPFHELQIAAFWVKSGELLKVLNFSNRPSRLLLYVNPTGIGPMEAWLENTLAWNLVLWPLIASSSIVVKHRDGAFKPEYIVPQMVLQWLTHRADFDGVCYFSTHISAHGKPNPLPVCNLVFPAREIGPKGRCKRLRGKFKMTEPHSWQMLRAILVGEGTPGCAVPTYDLEFIKGVKEQYYTTEFGMVQTRLNKLAYNIIAANSVSDPELGDVKE